VFDEAVRDQVAVSGQVSRTDPFVRVSHRCCVVHGYLSRFCDESDEFDPPLEGRLVLLPDDPQRAARTGIRRVSQAQDELPCGVGHRHRSSIEIPSEANIGRSSYFLGRGDA
jgi:hypothetical protein